MGEQGTGWDRDRTTGCTGGQWGGDGFASLQLRTGGTAAALPLPAPAARFRQSRGIFGATGAAGSDSPLLLSRGLRRNLQRSGSGL